MSRSSPYISRSGAIEGARPRDARGVRVRQARSSVVSKQSGTIDSDSSKFFTNSTVLSIPTSQGVFGRRKETAVVRRTPSRTVERESDESGRADGSASDRRFGT